MIPPDQCLRRWCRICTREMSLGYRSIGRGDRAYGFYCTWCGVNIPVYEYITPKDRQRFRSWGWTLEPLTNEEEGDEIVMRESWLGFMRHHAAGGHAILESRLGPDECLRRRCRICECEMELEYLFDDEERQYTFHCTRCNTTVRLFEIILKEDRELFLRDGATLEALSEHERALQNSDRMARAVWKIWVAKKYLPAKRGANWSKHRMGYDEAEKLR